MTETKEDRITRFALKRLDGKTLEEIGDEESPPITRERVRQVLGDLDPLKRAPDALAEALKANPTGTAKELAKAAGLSYAPYTRLREMGWVRPPRRPKPLVHGTNSGYTYHDCRCRECRAENARKHSEWIFRVRERGIPPEKHGTNMGYQIYACRCEACKKVNSDYQKAARKRLLAKKRAVAVDG